MHTAYQTQKPSAAQWFYERTSDKNPTGKKQTNVISKGGMFQPAPKLSVCTCQLTLTARHACVEEHMCSSQACCMGMQILSYNVFLQRQQVPWNKTVILTVSLNIVSTSDVLTSYPTYLNWIVKEMSNVRDHKRWPDWPKVGEPSTTSLYVANIQRKSLDSTSCKTKRSSWPPQS